MRTVKLVRLEYMSVSNRNHYSIADDLKTFTISTSHQVSMIKEWKQNLDARRDQARNKLVVGEDNYEIRHDQAAVEMITTEIPTSPRQETKQCCSTRHYNPGSFIAEEIRHHQEVHTESAAIVCLHDHYGSSGQ